MYNESTTNSRSNDSETKSKIEYEFAEFDNFYYFKFYFFNDFKIEFFGNFKFTGITWNQVRLSDGVHRLCDGS